MSVQRESSRIQNTTSSALRRLDGKVAIVTGGSGGIGRMVCTALAKQGANVVVVGRAEQRVSETVDKVAALRGDGATILGLPCDVTSQAEVSAMVEQTLVAFGRIDILVTCAGIGRGPNSRQLLPYPVMQMPLEEWQSMIATNLTGTFLSNRAVLPAMIRQRSGDIINVSSAASGLHGQPFAAAYSASKFAVVGMTQAVAEEVRQFGVRVQVLLPDVTDTRLLQNTSMAAHRGPLLPPERVADFVAYMVALPDDAVLDSPVIANCEVILT